MNSLRLRKIATVGCAALLASSLSFAQTGASTATPAKPTHKASTSKTSSSKSGSKKTATKSSEATGTHRPSTRRTARATSARTSGKTRRSRKSARSKGQQKIDPSRTQEIQQALIREHYLNGDPSGNFDDATQQALRRYQSANGWQSKTVPDARALIKLGLGPDHEHLLNPDSAMTMTMPSQTPHNVQYSTSQNAQDSQDKIQQ